MNWILPFIVVVVVGVVLFAMSRASLVPEERGRAFVKEGALVVDVREADEFQSGHVTGAVNIPLGELGQRFPKEVPNKEKVVLLHCLSGGRSGLAKRQLRSMGYPNVHNLGSLARAKRIVDG